MTICAMDQTKLKTKIDACEDVYYSKRYCGFVVHLDAVASARNKRMMRTHTNVMYVLRTEGIGEYRCSIRVYRAWYCTSHKQLLLKYLKNCVLRCSHAEMHEIDQQQYNRYVLVSKISQI